jgi:hypothetical protein
VQLGEKQLETGSFSGVFALSTGLQPGENQIEIARNVTVDVTPRAILPSPSVGILTPRSEICDSMLYSKKLPTDAKTGRD